MAKLLKSSADLVAAARARIEEVATPDLIARLGDPDVVVSAFGLRESGQLAVIENQTISDGSVPAVKLHTLDPRDGFASLDVADMDGDGAMDIVAVLSQEHEQVIMFRNEGGMRFSSHLVWAAPHPSWAFTNIQVVDINADGLPDIATVNGDSLDYNEVKPHSSLGDVPPAAFAAQIQGLKPNLCSQG